MTHESQDTHCQCRLAASYIRDVGKNDTVTRNNAPVLPNSPIRSFDLSENETLCSTGGSSGAYLITKSSTTISSLLSLEGQ